MERRVDEAEDVVAGAVGDGGLHGIGADLAGVGQQFQLLDFLGGGEQIAFDSRGDQLDGFLVSGQADLGQSLADPLR